MPLESKAEGAAQGSGQPTMGVQNPETQRRSCQAL